MLSALQILSLACAYWLVQLKLVRMPVSGSILTGYAVNMYIGSPPVLSSDILLDTGSSLTIITCSDCLNCNDQASTLYNPATSFSSSFPRCVPLNRLRFSNSPFAVKIYAKEGRSSASSKCRICRGARLWAELSRITSGGQRTTKRHNSQLMSAVSASRTQCILTPAWPLWD